METLHNDSLGEVLNEINEIQTEIISTNQYICECKEALSELSSNLNDQIKKFDELRMQLFMQILTNQGLDWCNDCQTTKPADSFEDLLLKGQKYGEGGYENSCYGYEPFSDLTHCCADCGEGYHKNDGVKSRGRYGSGPDDYNCTYVYPVNRTEDGFTVQGQQPQYMPTWLEFPKPGGPRLKEVMDQLGIPKRYETKLDEAHLRSLKMLDE